MMLIWLYVNYIKNYSVIKKLDVLYYPRILIIILKRFEFKKQINKYIKFKLNNYLEFPFNLNLNELLYLNNFDNELSNIDYEYNLMGIIMHEGDQK